MRVDLLTREYPPHVYGGAGVHVLELAKVLRGLVDDLRVQAFDGPREPGTDGADPIYPSWQEQTPLCGRSVLTSRLPLRARDLTWSTPTPGMPILPVMLPRCWATFRT